MTIAESRRGLQGWKNQDLLGFQSMLQSLFKKPFFFLDLPLECKVLEMTPSAFPIEGTGRLNPIR
jgi:hypothetical protein